MALNVGRLFVTLDANASGLFRTLSRAADDLEKFAKHVKRAAKDVGEVATALSAVGASALAMAAKVDGRTAAAMSGLETATKQVAVPIAHMLIPAVQALTKEVQEVARWIDGLNPSIKAAVSQFAPWVLAIAGGAMMVSKLAGVVSGLAGIFSSVFGAIAAIGTGPLLGIIIGLSALVVAVVFLHRAWRTNWNGIRDFTAEVVETITGFFKSGTSWIGEAWAGLFKLLKSVMNNWLDIVARIQKTLGVNWIDTEGMRSGLDGLLGDLQNGEFFSAALKFGKDTAKQFGAGFMDELGIIKKELGLEKLFSGISSGGRLAGLQSEDEIKARAMLDPESLKFIGGGVAPTSGQISTEAMRQTTPLASIAAIQQQQFTAMSREMVYRAKLNDAIQWSRDAVEHFTDGLKLAGQMMLSRLGDAGSIIQNAVRGFEQAGPAGAALAVLADFASRTQAFTDLVGVATSVVGSVTQAFEPAVKALTVPLASLTEALGTVLEPVLGALTPAFAVVGQALKAVAPILWVVGRMLSILAPALELLIVPLHMVVTVLEPFLKVLYEVLRIIGMGLVTIVSGLLQLWNGFVAGVAAIVDQVVATITFGAIKNGGDFLRAMTASTTGVDAALEALKNTSYDAASGNLAAAAAASSAAATIDQFSQSLTNVPSGFKTSLAEFNAMDAGAGFSLGAAAASSGGGSVNIENVTVQADDPRELARQLRAEARKETFRRTGNAHAYQRPNGEGVP